MGFDSDDEELLTEWPEFFNVDAVPHIRKSELKPKPKPTSFKSMESLLQEYNIRDQLDKKMSEFDSQSQGKKEGMASVLSKSVRSQSVEAPGNPDRGNNELS